MKERRKLVAKTLKGICKEEYIGRCILMSALVFFVFAISAMTVVGIVFDFKDVALCIAPPTFAIGILTTSMTYIYGKPMPKRAQKLRGIKKGMIDNRELLGALPISKKETIEANVRFWRIANSFVVFQIVMMEIHGIVFGIVCSGSLGYIWYPLIVVLAQGVSLLAIMLDQKKLYYSSLVISMVIYLIGVMPPTILYFARQAKDSSSGGNSMGVLVAVGIILLVVGNVTMLPKLLDKVIKRKYVWMG